MHSVLIYCLKKERSNVVGKKRLHLSPTFLYFLLRKLLNFNKNKSPYSPSSVYPSTILFAKNFEYLVLTHRLISATLFKTQGSHDA